MSEAHPYATGGGGTVLEHRYGAVLLSNLLTRDPVASLGDNVSPQSVRFQASSSSPVDDLLVMGRKADGEERRLSIGVRRDPGLVASDAKSVSLVLQYLKIIADHWCDVANSRWRLALAVASPNAAVQQCRELAVMARSAADSEDFRDAVSRPGRTNQAVRSRLKHLDALVEKAVASADTTFEEAPRVLCFQLLSALHVQELRLEGVDKADRTHAIARLRNVTAAGTLEAADHLFAALAELVGGYAPAGAEVTEHTLRRDLSGFPLARSNTYAAAWEVLDRLEARLRDRVRSQLLAFDGKTGLELERVTEREALANAMTIVARDRGTLIVKGDPDVGKSALSLRAGEQLERSGANVISLSLRDLPATTLELEEQLKGDLSEVLGGAATGSPRLFIVDGAEAVTEGWDEVLRELVAAALRSGLSPIVVTRSDGAEAVASVIKKAILAACGSQGPSPRVHEVPSLGTDQIAKITDRFPSLARLDGEPRGQWLLGRLGLVDLLLRSGSAGELGDGPLAEVDVFAVVWKHLVRCGEVKKPGGPSPDARERAMLALARSALGGRESRPQPEPEPLSSLRSDGLLLPQSDLSPWSPRDEFASDLIRDFSVARVLITDGLHLLDQAAAPRWALRASRLAVQTLLKGAPDAEVERRRVQVEFDQLSSQYGTRWSEIPLEAMLTLGTANEVLAQAWPALQANDQAELRMLFRVALQRYVNDGVGDSTVLAPLVELAVADPQFAEAPGWRDGQVRELLLAWLRGLTMSGAASSVLREEVRDLILEANPDPWDEGAVEALGLLGPDLDDRAEAFLAGLARSHASRLHPAVESVVSIISLAANNPKLLLNLTAAYYIEAAGSNGYSSSAGLWDEGIRSHQVAVGLMSPMAAWYYGPFYQLLRVRPKEALQLINRMLNHAAEIRVSRLASLDRSTGTAPPETLPQGHELPLTGKGPTWCVGDSHVWQWYRGSGVGPYPCMSALLAVERFADELLESIDLPVETLVRLLLEDCHNLAMPGLVVGFLVRHGNATSRLLDPWLSRPDVWELEFSRVTNERSSFVRRDSQSDLIGDSRRGLSFRDVVAETTLRAVLAEDEVRLDQLRSIGRELIQEASDQVAAGTRGKESLDVVKAWASLFDGANYHRRVSEEFGAIVTYEPPEEVSSSLEPALLSLSRGNLALRLLLTYAGSEDRSYSVDTLDQDLALARELLADPPERAISLEDAIAAVAAAAIVAHAQGRVDLSHDDLQWSADVLFGVIEQLRIGTREVVGSVFPMGADRSAAYGAAALLLISPDDIEIDRARLAEALKRCACSAFDEVRLAFCQSTLPIWESPCDSSSRTGECRHSITWSAVEAGIAGCALGDWDPNTGRRGMHVLTPPFSDALSGVETDRLIEPRLRPPLVAAARAASSHCCVAGEAADLTAVLFATQRRAWAHWADEGYGGFQDQGRMEIGRVLLEIATAGNQQPLSDYIAEFAFHPRALGELLQDLNILFTYDADCRASLAETWRSVMTVALDAVDSGAEFTSDRYWSQRAIGGLIPRPRLRTEDTDPDSTLAEVRRSWIDPESLSDLVARWIPIARGVPEAVDAVVELAQCASPVWQAREGLSWVEGLVKERYGSVAGRCWYLADWLERLRASDHLDGRATARWQRIVDGLAAEGDSRALALQRAEE